MGEQTNFLVMGGDQRYVEVVHQLSQKGIHIYLAGYDHLSFSEPNVQHIDSENADLSEIDGILLPLSGTNAKGEVEAEYTDKQWSLTLDMLKNMPKHAVVYTGISNEYLDRITSEADRKLVKLIARDDVAILNSIPTAEATLGIAIQETDITIHGANVLILGFGRTGITLARLFAATGANVSVAVRKEADAARITEMGLLPVRMEDINEEVTNMDICINTVPHEVLNEDVISHMSPSSLIIDIASKPGGTDFKAANEKGIKAIHALGLPGKTAPKSAGEIISSVLLKLLQK